MAKKRKKSFAKSMFVGVFFHNHKEFISQKQLYKHKRTYNLW